MPYHVLDIIRHDNYSLYITLLGIIVHLSALGAQQGSFLNAIMTLIWDFPYETRHRRRDNLAYLLKQCCVSLSRLDFIYILS